MVSVPARLCGRSASAFDCEQALLDEKDDANCHQAGNMMPGTD
jgi:hypothetical protein